MLAESTPTHFLIFLSSFWPSRRHHIFLHNIMKQVLPFLTHLLTKTLEPLRSRIRGLTSRNSKQRARGQQKPNRAMLGVFFGSSSRWLAHCGGGGGGVVTESLPKAPPWHPKVMLMTLEAHYRSTGPTCMI